MDTNTNARPQPLRLEIRSVLLSPTVELQNEPCSELRYFLSLVSTGATGEYHPIVLLESDSWRGKEISQIPFPIVRVAESESELAMLVSHLKFDYQGRGVLKVELSMLNQIMPVAVEAIKFKNLFVYYVPRVPFLREDLAKAS